MTIKTFTVGIAEDAIEQIAKVSLDRAVEELIWNALDAEASRARSTHSASRRNGFASLNLSGAFGGHANFVKTVANPKYDRHDELLEWSGHLDPEGWTGLPDWGE